MHKFAAGFDNTRVVQEMADCLYQAIYFSVMVIVGYTNLKDESYFPSCMGGVGDIAGLEIARVGITEALKSYYNVQLGYYVHSLVYLHLNKKKSDTLGMVLYSQVALFLAFSAYAQGYERFGVVLLFLHDVGNALAFSLKVLKEGEMFLPTMMVFAALMPIWMYTRIYLLSIVLLPRLTEAVMAREQSHNFFLQACLLPVFLLVSNHVYRFFTLACMGMDAVMGGNTKFSS